MENSVEPIPCLVDPAEIEDICGISTGSAWETAGIRKAAVLEHVVAGTTEARAWHLMGTAGHPFPDDFDPRDWHERRIAHLVSHPSDDPIILEFDDFGDGMEPVVTDGNHRLLAALHGDRPEIRALVDPRDLDAAREALRHLVILEPEAAPEP